MCVCVCVHIDEKVAAFSKRDESNLRSIVKLALSKERSMQFLLAPPPSLVLQRPFRSKFNVSFVNLEDFPSLMPVN